MRQIIRAETMGFCMGVRRAIELTEGTLKSPAPRPVSTLGPLIHNRLVLEKFKNQGVLELSGPENFTSGTVIIRAHGVPPDVITALEKKGANIIDATCNRVIVSMRNARSRSDEDYFVLLVGDENHGEIQAIAGYAKNYAVILPAADTSGLHLPDKTVIIGQTTLRHAEYDKVCNKIRDMYPNVRIINTVCPATEKRQDALLKIITQVDAVIVIGGRQSSNTKKLYETAKSRLDATWHVETEEDLPEGLDTYDRIGITAGASTPDWLIDRIERRIRDIWQQKI